MRVELLTTTALRFDDGTPVRAASGLAPLGADLLVVQDDATHGCLWRDGVGRRLRLLPPVEGHDLFDEASGTKELKPDLEAAVGLPDSGQVLLLGSGSTGARTRSVLVSGGKVTVADLAPWYDRVSELLDVRRDQLNLEGACVVGEELRWFQRGLPAAGVPTASVAVDLRSLLDAAAGRGADQRAITSPVHYDLGTVSGVGLAITDAVALDDGLVLVTAAAEDSPTTYDDGPVVGSVLALLDGDGVLEVAPLPELDGRVAKLEGLTVTAGSGSELRLAAVTDADDPAVPSAMLELRLAR